MPRTRRIAATAALATVLALAACGEERSVDWEKKVAGFSVVVSGNDLGTAESPLRVPDPTALEPVHFTIAITAQGSGHAATAFEGWVRVSSRPGTATVDAGPDSKANDVFIHAGATTTVGVTLTKVFGPTHIWAEDIGYVPKPADAKRLPQCSDGIDNDGDGTADFSGVLASCKADTDCPGGKGCCQTTTGKVCLPAAVCQQAKDHPTQDYRYYTYGPDVGCVDQSDDSEGPGTGAAGNSDTLWFDTPTIAQVQGTVSTAPYVGETILVTHGTNVVTRISTDGMFLTDVSDTSGQGYNSIFIYNFNTPALMRVCDQITMFTGNLSDFYGFTEVNFPNWNSTWWDERKVPVCPVPEPHVLTPAEIADNTVMQKYEAGLVRVENVLLSDRPRSCDIDGNGTVDYTVTAENDCQNACDPDWTCTEAVNYLGYEQYAVGVTDGKTTTKILIGSHGTIPQFDPFGSWRTSISSADGSTTFDPAHPDVLRSITGTVRVWRGGPRVMWTIETRCPQDLCGPDSVCSGDKCCTGDPVPANEACVHPRTGEEIDEQQ